MGIGHIFRAIQIFYIWLKYGLDDVLFTAPSFRAFRWVPIVNPFNWFRSKKISRHERLRKALETLGPLYVKFGQLLSTRRDILSDELATELAKLQDHVTPFSGDIAVKKIEKELEAKLDTVFATFDRTPLASASIAQVHSATLLDGKEVVVKVLRPDIERLIKRDVAFLYFLAKWVTRLFKQFRRFRLTDVVHEIENTLSDEVDLMREASNAAVLRRNFEHTDDVYIPEIIWPHCRNQLLVLEKISGIPVNDVQAIKDAGVNMQDLAETGVDLFYTQVFDHCFFHADLHPGNVFVDVANPKQPRFILVDFGIVGSLSPEDQHYLAANFLAFFERDYRRVAKLHIDSGWVPAKTKLAEFESAMRTVSEPIFERPLKDISLGMTLMRLFQIAKKFEMETLPQLLLLQKTLFNVESLARSLYPELNVWENCKPFLKRWMKEQIGMRGLWKRFQSEMPIISERLPEVPGLLYQALKQVNNPQSTVVKRQSKKGFFWGFVTAIVLIGVLAFVYFHGYVPYFKN